MGGPRESLQLRIRLFGGPSVDGAHGPVRLPPQDLALLTLVYGHGMKGLSRPRVAWLLWRSDADSVVRHRIRQVLVDIRTRAGCVLIDTPGDDLRPRPEVSCDLTTFEQALNGGSLHEAASLAAQGFADLPLRSVSGEYEDWRSARSVDLIRRLRVRASTRWSDALEKGEWTSARDAAEALYSLHPDDPQAVQRVIEARARVGKPASAEVVFATYLESLEPDQEPSPEILDTVERVRRLGRAGADVCPDAEDEVPFIGRRKALAAARTVFGRVEGGDFTFVLISGEAGIGKTRMLQELRREAVLRDFRCLSAQSVELERCIPLNPLLDALSKVDLRPHLSALGKPWDAVIGALLPAGLVDQPLGEPPPIQDSALPRRLLDAFSLLLERLAQEQPTLLFLDDLQWADETTIAALQFVQRRWTHGPLGVIATVRTDLVGQADPVMKYLPGSDGLAVRSIELRELSRPEADQLIDHIGEGEISEDVADRICALAGLHPLYLTELTRDYLAGRLRLPEPLADDVTIPVSLTQILSSRILSLSDKSMKVAGLLAVGARPMRLSDLAALANLTLDETADCADELMRSRLVQVERDRVRIAHELFRRALYRHLSEPRRAINHRALAGHILSEGPEESAGELATHYARAGESELAAKYGWAAASRAMVTRAPPGPRISYSSSGSSGESVTGCPCRSVGFAPPSWW